MFKSHLTIALRNLWRHRMYESINLAGLAIGFTSFLLLLAYVYHETTYDAFHGNAAHLYRVNEVNIRPTGESTQAITSSLLAQTLRDAYPELVNTTRIESDEYWMTVQNETFKQEVHFADPSFLDMFSFPLVRGRPDKVLEDPHTAVVTEDFAARHFSNQDPIGRVLTLKGKYDFVIDGVLRRIPSNSSLRFEVLLPTRAIFEITPDYEEHWWSSGSNTFVQVSKAWPASALAQQLSFLAAKHLPDFLRDRVAFRLQPLRRIHLEPGVLHNDVPPIAPAYLYALSAIACAILLIACLNFVNLSTARQSQRAKEIGVRQVIGASHLHLFRQFLGESILLTLAALVVSIGLVELFLPMFNALTGIAMDLTMTFPLALGLLALGLCVGVLAGSYPAFVLSRQQPLESLTRMGRHLRRRLTLRRLLVTVQFAIAVFLICCTLVIARQIQFMQTSDLGFNPDDVIAVSTQMDLLDDGPRRIDALAAALDARRDAGGLRSVCRSEHVPGFPYNNTFGVVVPTGEKPPVVNVTSIDDTFLDTYGVQLREGRTFSPAFGTDEYDAVLVNEAFVRLLGWDAPLGREITFAHGEGPYRVIGVVADFHFEPLQRAIAPQVYRYAGAPWRQQYLSVRVRPGATQQALRLLASEWKRIIPDVPLTYTFVEDHFATQYGTQVKTSQIVGSFSLLAILLACLGVFGLVSLAATQRTKEIGIRKALGASLPQIVLLLSKDFLVLVLVAVCIAVPPARLAMQRWLENFAYRMDLGPGVFILAGSLTLVIALLTLNVRAIRAALTDPVDALRYE